MKILKKYSVVLVEDDTNVSENMFKLLKLYFKEVHSFEDAESACKFIRENNVSIIMTDIELSEMNGLQFAKKVKEFRENIEIIVLTSFITVEYLKEAVTLHLIDYLEKPISLDKLESTLQICAQKIKKNLHKITTLSEDIVINFCKKELYVKDEIYKLSHRESSFLEILVRDKGKIISKEFLLQELWEDQEGTSAALRNLLLRVRKKLGDKEIIKNHQNYGYYVE